MSLYRSRIERALNQAPGSGELDPSFTVDIDRERYIRPKDREIFLARMHRTQAAGAVGTFATVFLANPANSGVYIHLRQVRLEVPANTAINMLAIEADRPALPRDIGFGRDSRDVIASDNLQAAGQLRSEAAAALSALIVYVWSSPASEGRTADLDEWIGEGFMMGFQTSDDAAQLGAGFVWDEHRIGRYG